MSKMDLFSNNENGVYPGEDYDMMAEQMIEDGHPPQVIEEAFNLLKTDSKFKERIDRKVQMLQEKHAEGAFDNIITKFGEDPEKHRI